MSLSLSSLCLLLLCMLFLIFMVLNICNFIQRTEQVPVELDISAIEEYILFIIIIDVITEIAEDCRGFEYSLLGRYYGPLIRIYWEFLKNL